jgi:hypothetical protein
VDGSTQAQGWCTVSVMSGQTVVAFGGEFDEAAVDDVAGRSSPAGTRS